MSQFAFLQREWAAMFEAASKAEDAVRADPRTACFYARRAEARGLGLFVRSLVGMDRSAAKDALAGFIGGRTLTANQLEFVNLIVDHLTKQDELNELMRALEAIRANATAA